MNYLMTIKEQFWSVPVTVNLLTKLSQNEHLVMELGVVDNSPTMWIDLFILVGIPIIVLVVGFLLFYFKPRHRRIVGAGLIVAVILEVSYYWFRYPYIRLDASYPIEILTLLFAVVSLFYSTKYAKRKL